MPPKKAKKGNTGDVILGEPPTNKRVRKADNNLKNDLEVPKEKGKIKKIKIDNIIEKSDVKEKAEKPEKFNENEVDVNNVHDCDEELKPGKKQRNIKAITQKLLEDKKPIKKTRAKKEEIDKNLDIEPENKVVKPVKRTKGKIQKLDEDTKPATKNDKIAKSKQAKGITEEEIISEVDAKSKQDEEIKPVKKTKSKIQKIVKNEKKTKGKNQELTNDPVDFKPAKKGKTIKQVSENENESEDVSPKEGIKPDKRKIKTKVPKLSEEESHQSEEMKPIKKLRAKKAIGKNLEVEVQQNKDVPKKRTRGKIQELDQVIVTNDKNKESDYEDVKPKEKKLKPQKLVQDSQSEDEVPVKNQKVKKPKGQTKDDNEIPITLNEKIKSVKKLNNRSKTKNQEDNSSEDMKPDMMSTGRKTRIPKKHLTKKIGNKRQDLMEIDETEEKIKENAPTLNETYVIEPNKDKNDDSSNNLKLNGELLVDLKVSNPKGVKPIIQKKKIKENAPTLNETYVIEPNNDKNDDSSNNLKLNGELLVDLKVSNPKGVKPIIQKKKIKKQNNENMSDSCDAIKIENFSIAHGSKDLFVNTNLYITYGTRYGLVGPNGCGKTTLMNHLAFRMFALPPNLDIKMYCGNSVAPDDTTTIDSVLKADKRLIFLLNEWEKLNSEQENSTEFQKKGNEVYDELESIKNRTAYSRAKMILTGLGLSEEMHNICTKNLSKELRIRVSLARLLFLEPTLLLLDEPTIYLDSDAIVWLENYLQRWEKTLIIASNQQSFLDNVCNEIINLDQLKLHYHQ